jgi:alcohol dehydrogenase class IV
MSLFGALRLPATVVLGSGHRQSIGSIASQIGTRALVCTDERLGSDAQFRGIIVELERSGVEAKIFDRTLPDLPIESITGCVAASATFAPQLVIGVGGGSCMDMAKAVALLLKHGGKIDDYYGEFKVPGPVLPIIAVPTTSGTGSEVTPVAVVADVARGLKIGVASPYLIPVAAICDPELTLSCPPALTAYTAGDALTHAIESYTALARPPDPTVTQKHVFVGKNVLSDQFALLAISSIWKHVYRAYKNGADLEAREHLMLGALAAGCAFGIAGTAAAHALQYPVGNLTHTAHGAGVATLLPYVMEFNRPACVAAFAQIARTVGIGGGKGDDDTLSRALVDAVAELLGSIGIPRTLQDHGLAADRQEWVAENAISITRLVKNNPRALDLQAMRNITRAAYLGDRLSLREV